MSKQTNLSNRIISRALGNLPKGNLSKGNMSNALGKVSRTQSKKVCLVCTQTYKNRLSLRY